MAEQWGAPSRRAQVSFRIGGPLATVSLGSRARPRASVSQQSSRTPSPQSSYVPGQQHGLRNYSKLDAPRLEAVRAALSSPAASPRPGASPTASPAASPRRASYHVSQPSSPISPQQRPLSQAAWPPSWPPPAVASRPPPQRRLTLPQASSALHGVPGTGSTVRHTLMSKEDLQRTLQRCQRTLEADIRRLTKQPLQAGGPPTPQTPRRSPVQTPAPPPPEAVPQPQCLTSAQVVAPVSSPRSSPGPEQRSHPTAELQIGPTSPEQISRLVAPGAALSQVKEESEIIMEDAARLNEELLEKQLRSKIETAPGTCRVPFGDLSNTILAKQVEAVQLNDLKKVDNIKDDEDISTEDQAVPGGPGCERLESLDSSSISALSPRGGSCPSVSSLGLWDPSPQHSECHRPLVSRMTSLPFSDVATPPPRDTLYWPPMDNSASESSFSVHLNMSPLVPRNGSSPAPTPQCHTPCNASCATASSRRSNAPIACHGSRGCLHTSGTRRCFEWPSPGLSVSQSSLMSSLLSISAVSLPKVEHEQDRIAKAIGELAQLEDEYRQTQRQLDDMLAAREAEEEPELKAEGVVSFELPQPPELILGEEAHFQREPGSHSHDDSGSLGADDTNPNSMEMSPCGSDDASEPPDAGSGRADGTSADASGDELAERWQSDCKDLGNNAAGPDVGDGQAEGIESKGSNDATTAYASDGLSDSSGTSLVPGEISKTGVREQVNSGSSPLTAATVVNHLLRPSEKDSSCSRWCWAM